MRNPWRLLLRHHRHSSLSSPNSYGGAVSLLQHHHQVTTATPSSSRYLSTVLLENTTFNTPHSQLFLRRRFTDDSLTSGNPSAILVDIFSKSVDDSEIQKELESSNVVLTHDLIIIALESLKSNPEIAIKFFGWVFGRESARLSSKSYNLMLKILCNNGFVVDFWDMVAAMKGKGYGVSKGAFIEASKKFKQDGLLADLEKLKGLFSKELDVTAASSRVSKIVRREVWDDAVERELRELGVSYSSELVKVVLEKLSSEPMKGLIFFRWVQESGLFKHDGVTYNAMAIVLGREDCVDRFWNVVNEMRNDVLEMEKATFVKVMGRFIYKRMLKDAVALYEFAMDGMNKPSKEDCTYLLRKIVVAGEFDIDLFSRVVRVFTEKGFTLQDSMLDAVIKSLTSVGRMKECNKVLQAMLDCGYRPSGPMQARVAFDLSSSKMRDEANEFVQKLEHCGLVPDCKMWTALIEGHCVAGDVDEASDCLRKMIKLDGVDAAGYPLYMLVSAYCNRHRAAEACKVLSNFVNIEGLRPWHTTYKLLVGKLLYQKGFHEALSLLSLMKNDGFPPFLNPFIAYLSRKGTADEAMMFFKAMTVNKYPSTSVFIQVFEAFCKAGRHSEAQNLLSKCPQYIRNNADVLDLFCSMKSEKPETPAAIAA